MKNIDMNEEDEYKRRRREKEFLRKK